MKKPLCLVLLLALSACNQNGSSETGGSGSGDVAAHPAAAEVVARVNGAPITEADVKFRLQNDSHEAAQAPGAERRKAALDTLVTREILAQKALAEGLDQDPKYQEDLRKMEAQLAAFKRQELSELLLRREAEKRSVPTEAEARAFFDKNQQRIRTRVHVLQILKRSENAILEMRSMIERGKSFEEVARSQLPGTLPEGQTPWDLGYLPFYKVPEPWRDTVYDMKPGEVSGILRGPNERFWLVKLVDVKEDEGVTFESVKDAVMMDMKANKVQRTRADLEKELRAGARVEMVEAP
jgi:peptidyl-prolyl cis-trans isomerase C